MNVNDPRWASIDAFVEGNRDNILRDITRLVAVPSVEGTPEPGAPFGPGPKAALTKACHHHPHRRCARGQWLGR